MGTVNCPAGVSPQTAQSPLYPKLTRAVGICTLEEFSVTAVNPLGYSMNHSLGAIHMVYLISASVVCLFGGLYSPGWPGIYGDTLASLQPLKSVVLKRLNAGTF